VPGARPGLGAQCPAGSQLYLRPPTDMDNPLEALPLLPLGPGRPCSRGDHQGSRDRLILVLLHRARGCSTGFLRLTSLLPPWCSAHRADRGLGGRARRRRQGWGVGDVLVVVPVALLLVLLVPVVARVGAQLPLLPLLLEVRPGHPSSTHGQGASRCGRSRVRTGALVHSSRQPCSPVLLHCSRHPGLHPLSPASHLLGLGGGTRPH